MAGLADRLRLFEPLLDELAARIGLKTIGPMESRRDAVSDAYHRCEVKRHRIGAACASNRTAVLDPADEVMHAIAHDHCPSGNRQLIEPLVAALGGAAGNGAHSRLYGDGIGDPSDWGGDGLVLGGPDGAVRHDG